MSESKAASGLRDWKIESVEMLYESLPSVLSVADDGEELDLCELLSSEDVEDRALLKLLDTVFPIVDFHALENGISSAQFGEK